MSSEDLESLIVSNESLLDPSVDTSRLKRTTDTRQELLGDLQPGLQYDPTLQSTYSDLLKYFSGDLDIAPAPVAKVITPTVVSPTDGGGGGGGTIETGSGGQETGGNTNFEQNLINQGAGIQIAPGQPVVAPGEIPVTQAEIDAFNAPSLLDSTGGNIMDEVALTGGMPANLGDTGGSMDQMSSTMPSMLGDTGGSMDQMSGVQRGLVDQAFSKVGATVDNVMDDLSKIPGAVADFANKTVDVAGQKINVGKTLAGLAINKVVGAPVSLVFEGVKALAGALPEQPIETTIVDELKNENDYGYNITVGNLNVDPFGRNPVSGFGDYEGTLLDDITNPSNTAFGQAKKDFAQDYFDKKAAKFAPQENIGATDSIDDLAAERAEAGLNTITGPNIDEEEGRPDDPGGNDPSGPTDSGVAPGTGAEGPAGGATMSGPSDDFADDFDDGTMTGAAATTTGGDPVGGFFDAVDKGIGGSGPPSSGFSAPSQQGQSPRGSTTGGGGNSGGGGKIVCTMMNESYGFGSFRNKIWLRHSKDLAPEYQKGYHKIFLPLVRLSKTNKFLKKTLEHIAVHRTIDIRQESRGKVHLLGRVYRKILEPICYWVGKHG